MLYLFNLSETQRFLETQGLTPREVNTEATKGNALPEVITEASDRCLELKAFSRSEPSIVLEHSAALVPLAIITLSSLYHLAPPKGEEGRGEAVLRCDPTNSMEVSLSKNLDH